jgi:DNA-binding response OmpR family regulator
MQLDEVTALRALVDELREENRQLKDILRPPDNPFYGRLGLSPQLAALLNAFYHHDELPHARLDEVISLHSWETRGSDRELVYERARVAVCKLRALLRPHGIVIDRAQGMGYRMDRENKRKLEAIMEGWQ